MMFRRNTRIAALVFALMIVLGLGACGVNLPSESQIGSVTNTNIQDKEPTVPEYTIEQTEPDVSDTSSEDYVWIGPSGGNGRQYVLVFYSDFVAKLYEYDPERNNTHYLEHPYECSWTQDGDVISLSVYEGDGDLAYVTDYIMDQDTFLLYSGGDEIVGFFHRGSNNNGIKHSLTGKWWYVDGSRTMEFYDDGSFRTDQFSGSYQYTSKYDQHAVSVYDESTGKRSTYCYEFLENDLLLLYDNLDSSKLMMFYRSN